MDLLEKHRKILFENTVDFKNLDWYAVGGQVRDFLRGETPADLDFVVVGETPESMEERGFQKIEAQSFPVYLDDKGNEFALARRERSTGDGYHDFECDVDEVSLMEDLERRDFTVNSLAMTPGKMEFHGKQDWLKDLHNRVFRHTSDAFVEDPVRVLRLARFAARFPSWTIADETKELAEELAPKLESVPGERIKEEVLKGFEQAENPAIFIAVLREIGAGEYVFGEFGFGDLLSASAGPDEYHEEPSLYEHLLQTVVSLDVMGSAENGYEYLMCFLHDVGKLDHAQGHDKKGVKYVDSIADKWKLSNELRSKLIDACRLHMRVHYIDPEDDNCMREAKVIRLVQHLDSDKGINEGELLRLAEADSRGRFPAVYNHEKIERIRDRLALAREAVGKVDAEYVVESRDASIEDYEGEAIGQMIENDRIHYMKHLEDMELVEKCLEEGDS